MVGGKAAAEARAVTAGAVRCSAWLGHLLAIECGFLVVLETLGKLRKRVGYKPKVTSAVAKHSSIMSRPRAQVGRDNWKVNQVISNDNMLVWTGKGFGHCLGMGIVSDGLGEIVEH